MTEKKFAEAIDKATGTGWSKRIADLVLPIVREAGMEFAPEPPRLPERIKVRDDGLWDETDAPLSFAEHAAMLEAARDRYNAYPKLYAEADELVEKAQNFIGRVPTVLAEKLIPIREAVADLEDALAKGPKP